MIVELHEQETQKDNIQHLDTNLDAAFVYMKDYSRLKEEINMQKRPLPHPKKRKKRKAAQNLIKI